MLALTDRSIIDAEFRVRRSVGRCLADISLAISHPFALFIAAIAGLPAWIRQPLCALCMGAWCAVFVALLYGSFIPILYGMASPDPDWGLLAAAWAVWISGIFTMAFHRPVGLFWIEDRLYNHAMRHAVRRWNQSPATTAPANPPALSSDDARILAAPATKPDADLP